VPRVDGNLISHLSRLNWDGNIRQLENTLKRMLVLNHKSLTMTDLPKELSKTGNSILEDALLQHQSLDDLSKQYVHMVLNQFDGNKKEACKFLNINYRTLQRKLQD
jgi:DNA-binding NtrC family response regulator